MKKILLGVLGHPVQHSLSPKIHTYWLRHFGIDGQYLPIDTDGSKEDFESTVHRLQAEGYCGANVTLPHKQNAYKICNWLSPEAQRVGAVNTLVFLDNHQINGYNTDIYGFIRNINNHTFYAKCKESACALIIGAGGAMRSVLLSVLQEGFTDIHIVNRTISKAEQIVSEYIPSFPDVQFRVSGLGDLLPIVQHLPEHALVVNASSLGFVKDSENLLGRLVFSQKYYVTDIVYHPLITPFLHHARSQGMPIQDGFGMLLYQGAESFRIWLDKQPVVDADLREQLLKSV